MLNHQKRFFSTVTYRLMVKHKYNWMFIYDLSHEAVKKIVGCMITHKKQMHKPSWDDLWSCIVGWATASS